jgi:hypothetical protein
MRTILSLALLSLSLLGGVASADRGRDKPDRAIPTVAAPAHRAVADRDAPRPTKHHAKHGKHPRKAHHGHRIQKPHGHHAAR